MKKKPKFQKHSWCADIISPFNNVSKNLHASDKYELFFSHVVAFYELKEHGNGKSWRAGIQLQEGKSSPYGYKIHNGDLVNNEF